MAAIQIEVKETAKADGMHAVLVTSEPLPAGFYCRVYPNANRRDGVVTYTRKTRANGNGSIRYHFHASYSDALQAGVQWINRKVREARRSK